MSFEPAECFFGIERTFFYFWHLDFGRNMFHLFYFDVEMFGVTWIWIIWIEIRKTKFEIARNDGEDIKSLARIAKKKKRFTYGLADVLSFGQWDISDSPSTASSHSPSRSIIFTAFNTSLPMSSGSVSFSQILERITAATWTNYHIFDVWSRVGHKKDHVWRIKCFCGLFTCQKVALKSIQILAFLLWV